VFALAVGLGTWPISNIELSLEVETEGVSIVLDEEWSFTPSLVVQEIYIDNLIEVIPGFEIAENETVDMSLEGSAIIIEALILPKNAEIEFDLQGKRLTLWVRNAQLQGKLSVRQAELTQQEESISIHIEEDQPPRHINFITKASIYSARFSFTTDRFWTIQGLYVRALHFSGEKPPHSGRFQSLIYAGHVVLEETDITKKLAALDELNIGKVFKNKSLEISTNTDRITVKFNGSVEKIEVGSQKYKDNIAPTRWQYLYHNLIKF